MRQINESTIQQINPLLRGIRTSVSLAGVFTSRNEEKREKYFKTHYRKMFIRKRLKSYLSSGDCHKDFTRQVGTNRVKTSVESKD